METLKIYYPLFIFIGPLLDEHFVELHNYNEDAPRVTSKVPKICQIRIKTDVNDHFAQTTVVHKIENFANKTKEIEFSVFLPENALVSSFIFEVDGRNYTAYVEEKNDFEVVSSMLFDLKPSPAVVKFRDSFKFNVYVSVNATSKAAFYLTYEEVLTRKDDQYELLTNINPGELVEDLSVEVTINGSIQISALKTPFLRSGVENAGVNSELDPAEDTVVKSDNEIIVKFSPNVERQKKFAELLKTNENEGFSGQLIVRYDIERSARQSGGELFFHDGYFVQFFAPINSSTSPLFPFPQHVVFVLDTSSTMGNDNIKRAAQALHNILGRLHDKDAFSLVEMNGDVKVWNLNNLSNSIAYQGENDPNMESYHLEDSYLANSHNIREAQSGLSNISISGQRDIYTALKVALNIVDHAKNENLDGINRQPLIMLITSGDFTPEEEEITSRFSELISDLVKPPIFVLTFGTKLNEDGFQKLASQNYGFAKLISEADDASLQIETFYKQISSTLLTDVTFNYYSSVGQVTKNSFSTFFNGSDIIVAGSYDLESSLGLSRVDSRSVGGPISLVPVVKNSTTNTERMWAHLTIRQFLEDIQIADDNDEEILELKTKALQLALKYSLVTDVTSLVVVKPELSEIERYRLYSRLSLLRKPSHRNTAHVMRPHTLPIRTHGQRRTKKARSKLDLLSLSWLKSKLDESGNLSFQSRKYKLGLNETITDRPVCPKTPLNTVGHCTLLKDCPHVLSLLLNSDLLVGHFCVLKNEFAGICCPI